MASWWHSGNGRALVWALGVVAAVALVAAFVSPLAGGDVGASSDEPPIEDASGDGPDQSPQPGDDGGANDASDDNPDVAPSGGPDDGSDDGGMEDVDPSATPEDGALDARLDAYLNASFPETHMPGVAVAVVDANGSIYEREMGSIPSAQAPVLIGSLSKSFTAVCVMQLVEQGEIELDQPAARYLGDAGSLPETVTVRDLLNQTSGFGYYDSLAQALGRTEPGDTYGNFSYANANYDALGRIVERVSGQSYADYLRDHVLEPLGMLASTGDAAGELASGAPATQSLVPGERNWFGLYVPDGFSHVSSDEAWGTGPSGYVASSLADLETYLRMYLAQGAVPDGSGNRVLEATSVRSMFFARVPDPGGDTFYGMGWTSFYWDDGELVLSHDGSVEGYCARMVLLPERGIGIVLLTNGSDEIAGSSLFFELADGVVQTAVGDGPDPVDGSWYADEHASDDGFFLACLCVCSVACLWVDRWRGQLERIGISAQGWRGLGRRARAGVVLRLAAWPVLACLVAARPLAWGVPWRDLLTFVPDVSLVLVLCAGLLLIAGARRGWMLARALQPSGPDASPDSRI